MKVNELISAAYFVNRVELRFMEKNSDIVLPTIIYQDQDKQKYRRSLKDTIKYNSDWNVYGFFVEENSLYITLIRK